MTTLESCLPDVGTSIWEQTLGVPLAPCDDPSRGPAPMIQGQVQVTGQWKGTLVLQCSLPAARRAAAVMFDRNGDELTQDEIHDTVGELANMIGGTVKSMVATDGCFLSLPTVIEGSDFSVTTLGSRIVARQAFRDGSEPIVVTVLEAVA